MNYVCIVCILSVKGFVMTLRKDLLFLMSLKVMVVMLGNTINLNLPIEQQLIL